MAVRALDCAVLSMDLKFRSLMLTDRTGKLFGIDLSVSAMAGLLVAITLNLPATVRVRHHAVSISCMLHLTYRNGPPAGLQVGFQGSADRRSLRRLCPG